MIDFETQLGDLKKALDVAAASGVLVQPEVDKAIQDTLDHQNVLRQNLPRRRGTGQSALLNRKTAQPAGGGFVDDTEEPGSVVFTRARFTFDYKTILRRGRVTRKAQAIGASYKDLLAQEIEDTTILVRDDEETAFFNGDNGVNAKEFDGLRVQINAVASQVITPDVDGAQLSLGNIDLTVDQLLGRPNMMVMSKRTRRALWALLQQQQRFVDSVEVKGGFRVTAYAPDIAVMWTPFIFNTQDAGTSGAIGSDLFVLDNTHVVVRWLTNFHMEPLAKTSSQFDEFDIVGDETLVVENTERGAARLAKIIP